MSLNANALVTFRNLDNSMGLTKRGDHPYADTLDRIATKAGVGIYYYAQATPLAGYADSECPVYQDILPIPTVSVTIYARASYSSPSGAVKIKYRIGGNAWLTKQTTTLGNPTYSNLGSITVPEGEFIYFGIQNTSDVNVLYGEGNGGGYTSYCGQSAPYGIQYYANGSIYLNAKVNTSPPYIYSTC
jgi:hypothetical protein